MPEFVISCTKRRTRFEAQVAIVQLYCVHLMVRSQPGKKNGSTRSLVTKLCFGMSIHWTGEGQDRMSFAIASSKWLAPARLFWRTTFIPARSRRCRACWASSRPRASNSWPFLNWSRCKRHCRRNLRHLLNRSRQNRHLLPPLRTT